MDLFATSHFSHDALLRDLKTLDGQDRRTAAVLLSRVVEVEERRLFLREGYPSMYAYCIQGLHWCEGTASRRIYAARAARRFPVLFDAVADGRLHVTGVLMLFKYLSSGNVDELLAAATHKSKAEIQQSIANRFPQSDLPEVLQAITPPPAPPVAAPQGDQHSPENADAVISIACPPAPASPLQQSPGTVDASDISTGQPAPGPVQQQSQGTLQAPAPRDRMMPLAPGRFGFQCTLDQETHDLFEYIRTLMSHEIPTGEMALVLKGALQLAAAQLEKRKFAATTRPLQAPRGSAKESGVDAAAATRHIPAAVKREVWERDGGQCFISEAGHRCQARTLLEFEHEIPVARGGEATTVNIRLRCRGHNAYAAECAFGAEFMDDKREEARLAATKTKARARAAVEGRHSHHRRSERSLVPAT